MTIKKPTVLLVEDDPDTQALMNLVLRKRYDVLMASTGPDARAELAAHPRSIRLILMDLKLRGPEDGVELTRFIRTNEQWSGVPIIAATACVTPQDEIRAREAGCDEFLAKPFYPRELLRVVEHYMPPAEASGGEEQPPPRPAKKT